MMQFPDQQEIEDLTAIKEPFCVSIYAPLIAPNTATNPNIIEVKNLLKEAEIALMAAGAKAADIKKTLRPAKLLLADNKFWPVQDESLALFMHPKLFRYYYIPTAAAPYKLTVGTGFDVKPLQQVMYENREYYLLALGHKHVRLYEGDHFDLKPVSLKHLPSDMKEALGIDEYPESRETHTIAPASTGKGSKASHEQYNVSQTDKAMLLEFFRRIDKQLHEFLYTHPKPLVLAGVNYLLPIYRKVNSYPKLVHGAITGNQDRPNLQLLRDKAWHIIETYD